MITKTERNETVVLERELCVMAPNTPGQLARLTSALRSAGVNLLGVTTVNVGAKACLRFLADEAVQAKAVLEEAGYKVSERPVFLIPMRNRGEDLDRLASELGARGINILSCYGHEENGALKLVLAVDRPDQAAPLLVRLSR